MSADLYFTRVSSSFVFIRQLFSELAEQNSTIFGHVVGSKCNLKMHVRNLGYPFPLQIGGPKTTFLGRLRNSSATVTVYVFGTKHGIHNGISALQTRKGLLHRVKTTWTLVHKRLQIGSEIHPPSVNSAFHFIARLHRLRSANGTQPNFAKRWRV